MWRGGARGHVREGPSGQGINEDFGVLEVSGVESFGKPLVGLAEESARSGTLALTLPEPTQAHGGPQFQRFGLLLAGQGQRLLKLLFRPSRIRPHLAQQAFTRKAIDVCFPPTDPP